MTIGIVRETANASRGEASQGWRKASWRSVLGTLSRAERRIAIPRYVARLWPSSGPKAEAGRQLRKTAGTQQTIASEPDSRQSDDHSTAMAQGASLALVGDPAPIGRRSQVGKTTALVHDLNNLLSIVQANLQLLNSEISDEDQRTSIKDALDATELCDELIQGLYAERSGQITRRLQLDINEELGLIRNLIRKTLGPDISVNENLAHDLGMIGADPALFRNAVLNLVANARDAMTAGDRLEITTSKVEIDASAASNHIDAKPGVYVRLSLRDTGSGIAPATLRRVFDPHFTTKSPGSSLGVGLTLVREFCQRFEGFVRVESKEGRGTTVSIYLPRQDDRQTAR